MVDINKIIKASKKTLAEIMDELGPEESKALLKKMKQEAPAVPVGSGKNLEALQRAKVMAKETPPSYPKNITQDELGIKPPTEDFALVGSPYTKDFTLPAEGAGLPVVYQPPGLPATIAGKVDDGIPYLPSENVPMSTALTKIKPDIVMESAAKSKSKINPKVAALLGLGAVGIGSGVLLNQGDETPVIPEAPKKPIVPVAPTQSKPSVGGIKTAPKIAPLVAPVEEEEARSPASEEPDFNSLLKEAQHADSENRLIAGLLRAGTQAGAAIAGTQVDYTGADGLMKSAGQNSERIEKTMDMDISQKKLTSMKADLDDEDKLRDPDSDVSRMTREMARKVGIKVNDKMTAKQFKDQGINLSNLFSQHEAQIARREAAIAAANARKDSKDETNKFKAQGSVDRQVSQLLKSKDYEAYNAAKDANSSLDMALESGDKTASGSAFMQFAKIAQGDNSVVRDGDMAVLAGGYNYTSPSQMFAKLAAKAEGGNFNDQELKQMKAVAQKVREIKRARLNQQMSPVLNRANSYGLDLNETLDPSLVDEITKNKITTPSGSGKVKVTRISDGAISMMSKDSASRLDPSKFKVGQ